MSPLPHPVPGTASALVIGASFAGLCTAFHLARLGYRTTLVEIAPALRRGGTPVDLEGEAIEALREMGLLEQALDRVLPPRRGVFKDSDDQVIGVHGPDEPDVVVDRTRLEIHRDDLLDILFAAVESQVEIVFNRSVTRIADAADHVSVAFSNGEHARFTIVAGCDGKRSATRRLAFGNPKPVFMGGYFLLKVVPEIGLLPPNTSEFFSLPGLTAMLNGYEDRTDLGLIFREPEPLLFDHRDRAWQRDLMRARFADAGWKVPAMLALVDDDFYSSALNQIRIEHWSAGRVVLVGDAACCVSPLAGLGGSVALIGAMHLARALDHHGGNYGAAFRAYRNSLRSFIDEVQHGAMTDAMAMICPADAAALAERDRTLHAGTFQF